jgi:predicted transcriptional regulator
MTAAALTTQPRPHTGRPDTAADRVLRLLTAGVPTLASTVADLTGYSESYAADLLQRLHRRGLVQRVRHYSGEVGQPAWAYIRPRA